METGLEGFISQPLWLRGLPLLTRVSHERFLHCKYPSMIARIPKLMDTGLVDFANAIRSPKLSSEDMGPIGVGKRAPIAPGRDR